MDLLERQVQLGELSQHLRDAGKKKKKIVFVSGEAGAGKSTLVEEFAQQAPRATRVLWGYCDALQTSRVLGPVNEVLAGLSLSPDSPREFDLPREQIFSRLFRRYPANPLSIVVLEDLHWADRPPRLRTLCWPSNTAHPLLLIATHRDDELAPTHLLRGVLGELTGKHAVRIHVPILSFRAVEQLAQGTGCDAREVYAVTGGNPFFVRELLCAPTDAVPGTAGCRAGAPHAMFPGRARSGGTRFLAARQN
jgi:predicted ATPase